MLVDINIIVYVVSALLALALLWILRLELRIRDMLKGESGKSLEQSIISSKKNIEELEKFRKTVEEYLRVVEKRLTRSIQGIETMRFNPFKGAGEGGNQSFATTFLDEKGDGVVISSFYARDRVSVFAKPIKNHTSEFELTKEEKGVVEKVKKTIS